MTDSLTSSLSFESIEQLDELTRALNWTTEYRQLEPGSFSSTFATLEGDSWFLLEEQSSHFVEVVGEAPAGMHVLALVEGDPAAVNGRTMSSDHIFLQGPEASFRAILPAGVSVTQLGITGELYDRAMHAIAPELAASRNRVTVLPTAPDDLANLRQAMRAALLTPSNREATREEAVSNILADFVNLAADYSNEQPAGRLVHPAASRRALSRAREYIEANVGETIRVESLCRYSGTTLRSLERIFARELGVSPKQYLQARRLNAVRRHLLTADAKQGRRVTEVAQNYGFTHMGRFAGNYRRYFGELPSETLEKC